jgi:ABC-type transport system substrate-binding protein
VPEWDEVSDEILRTMDTEERLALWREWWDYFFDTAQYVSLYEMNYVYAMSEDFEWAPRPDAWMTFRDVKVANQ